ncbi:MAG: hypothetical protein N4A46_02315 [Schleiferiaceae bacterium]|nr:hypothetical protein [Schleiferiaceae bacterium]
MEQTIHPPQIQQNRKEKNRIFPQGEHDWLIFKTNVATPDQKDQLKHIIENETDIPLWTIDMEDVDNVLRVKETARFDEEHLISLFSQSNIRLEPMTW